MAEGVGVTEDSAFQDLIRRVRDGDGAAAEELVRLYEPAIRRAVRVRLNDPRMRRVLDSTDICQSVFGSFYVRMALGQYELEKPQQLMKLLTDMSRKKLIDQERRLRAARRDIGRLLPGELDEGRLAAPGDTPSQQVAVRDLLQEVRKRLSPEELALSEQRAQGRDWAQIAEEQGASPEALRKKLVRAVSRVTQELGLDD